MTKKDRRVNWVAGLSPANVITLAVLAAGITGTWFVMQDDIGDNKEDIVEFKKQSQQQHAAMWQRISGCK